MSEPWSRFYELRSLTGGAAASSPNGVIVTAPTVRHGRIVGIYIDNAACSIDAVLVNGIPVFSGASAPARALENPRIYVDIFIEMGSVIRVVGDLGVSGVVLMDHSEHDLLERGRERERQRDAARRSE